MALTLDSSGSYEPIADESAMASVSGPKVVAAALDPGIAGHDGSVLTLIWKVSVFGSFATLWTDTFTVDVATQGGYLTPPIPVLTEANLNIILVSGPAATPIPYEIYAL